MGSTSSASRQGHLFVALLILLWGLILCFVGYQYNRERGRIVGQLGAQLHLINMQVCDNLADGVEPSHFFERNAERFEGLEVAVVSCGETLCYGAAQGVNRSAEQLGASGLDFEQGGEPALRSVGEVEYIYMVSQVGESVVCSSCTYSLSFLDTFRGSNAFLIVAVAISLLISVIGYITARLYKDLDVTTQERDRVHETAQLEVQDKLRIKRQLTNNINHELKTPICSILGYMDMILNNPNITAEQSRSFVKKSYDQAERLRLLLADLSTITRIDEAAGMIERESVDLSALIADICDDVMPQLEKQNMVICCGLDQKITINGNYSLLYSVFRNLIDNSIAYSGGRNIWIDVTAEDDKRYYFSLRDNGIGVEEKHLPYIFERFYRVDKGRSRKVGGTGLGLSIVKNAVLFHGGSIVARQEEMGGLEFRFSLGDKIV